MSRIDHGAARPGQARRGGGSHGQCRLRGQASRRSSQNVAPSEVGISTRHGLAEVLWYQGRIAESEPVLEEALETANRLEPSPTLLDQISFQAMRNAALEVWLGRQAEHAALCQRWLTWAEAQLQFTIKGRAAGMVNLGPVADAQLQARAFTLARQAVEAAPTNALLV